SAERARRGIVKLRARKQPAPVAGVRASRDQYFAVCERNGRVLIARFREAANGSEFTGGRVVDLGSAPDGFRRTVAGAASNDQNRTVAERGRGARSPGAWLRRTNSWLARRRAKTTARRKRRS